MTWLLGFFLILEGAAGVPVDEGDEKTALDRFMEKHDYLNEKAWFSFEVTPSIVTETRRKIYASKKAVTEALFTHRGGRGRRAAKMVYADETVFVAESFAEDGKRLDTEVMVLRQKKAPMFLLFDEEGQRIATFHQPNDPPEGPPPGNVPRVCQDCHQGPDFFHPTMSFPNEPEDRKLVLDPAYRNEGLVRRFLEGFHRGGHVFSPFGAIWLSRLSVDAANGKLDPADVPFYKKLRRRYPEVLLHDVGQGK